MKEILELRVNNDYAGLLFNETEGRSMGASVRVIGVSRDDPRYEQIPLISSQVREKYNSSFFFGWEIKRKYTRKELDAARLLHLWIKPVFEPAGEECGTLYDETSACQVCGANRTQKGPLILKEGSIPLKKDIARTIAGEIVVSEKFMEDFNEAGLKGAGFGPVLYDKKVSGHRQLIATAEAELSQQTLAGIDPFDLSEHSGGEVYKCPKGHTLGLNLLSEPYIESSMIPGTDFFASYQKFGIKRGLLRPQPLYFCTQKFRKMVEEKKLTGFDFEITHVL